MQLEIFSEWEHILKKHSIRDIEYTEQYASLYGMPFMLYMEHNGQYALLIVIVNETFNDFETPYGYGGFHTNSNNKTFHDSFFSKVMQYFKDTNIIAGIIRFNPLIHMPLKSVDNICIRDIAVLDLEQYPEYMTSKCRNMIRRGIHNNAEYYFSKSNADMDAFAAAYTDMMIRMNGDPFICFDKSYFDMLFTLEGAYLCICRDNNSHFRGGAIFLITKSGTAYYHLAVYSGPRIPGMSNVLLDMGINKAKGMNAHTMIMGGGITSDKNDTLLNFKLSFGSLREPFYLGKIIIDKEAYRKKIEDYDKDKNDFNDYVLRYRYDR